MKSRKHYDAIVVGGGHAGIEAALSLSRLNKNTLLISLSLDHIGKMSCNPAVGGTAKGLLVREIDTLGGEMGKAIDKTGIHFRMLNMSRGHAVWSPRAQADKLAYQSYMKWTVENQDHLDVVQDNVNELVIQNNTVIGVITERNVQYSCDCTILTTGTFLRGLIHVGSYKKSAGRMGDPSSENLSQCLKNLGFTIHRLKTGTPPRVNKKTIDFSKVEVQPIETSPFHFSHFSQEELKNSIDVYITHTNEQTHNVIRNNLHLSLMHSPNVESIGPRYCPSIEDKVTRFSDKKSHQIFLEPEGHQTNEVYVNGLSTSLPENVQHEFIHQIPGLEEAHIMRIGYAIEYDFCPAYQIKSTLETKSIENLYFAGQINGTTGYEEAAAQGIIAGINAALKHDGKDPFILQRSQAYIGVLIDDLITKCPLEPYRIFTSRAEHRLLLRYDNADIRLMQYGIDIGLVDASYHQALHQKMQHIELAENFIKQHHIKQGEIDQNTILQSAQISGGIPLQTYLSRQNSSIQDIKNLYPALQDLSAEEVHTVQVQTKYHGYIQRENGHIKKLQQFEHQRIPETFNYDDVSGLLTEAREKLKTQQPSTLAQASRIPGVNPSDVLLLMFYLKSS